MKEVILREYHINAVNSIEQALKQGRKRIAIEIPVGCGNSVILLKLLDILFTDEIRRIFNAHK